MPASLPRPMRIGACVEVGALADVAALGHDHVGGAAAPLGRLLLGAPLLLAGGVGSARGLGHPGTEHVGADHRDRGEHEDPQDGEVGDPDEEEGELRHRLHPGHRRSDRPRRPRGSRTVIVVLPIRTWLPSRTPALVTLWPSMSMPLVEPRSRTSILRSSLPCCTSVRTSNSMWRRLTPGSLIRTSASVPRPTTRPGGWSGCRVLLISRTARARRTWVWVALLCTRACALLRIRNRPVVRSSAFSNSMAIGPGKT